MSINNVNNNGRSNYNNISNPGTNNKTKGKKDKEHIFDLDKWNKEEEEESIVKPHKDELGKDAFLHLLTTQLANQDPLDPMDDREFIAQLAQFSSLEQMNNLNDKTADMINAIDFLTAQTIEGGVITANEIYKIKRGLEEYLGIDFDDLIEKDKEDDKEVDDKDKDVEETEKPGETEDEKDDELIHPMSASLNEEIRQKMMAYRLRK